MSGVYDYGSGGLVGIGTPQANPNVEAEMAILLPPTIARVTARLTSIAPSPAGRLRSYLLDLGETLRDFDTLRPQVFGFACTASSYLVEEGDAEKVVERCEEQFGFPIITAAGAIVRALRSRGARRIALLSPYPAELAAAAGRYWSAQGFVVDPLVTASHLAPGADTRAIYALGSGDAASALARVDLSGVDAVLLSGTGMPTLPLIANWRGDVPLLSSNLCLAAALVARLGGGDLLDPAHAEAAAWCERCAAATRPV